MNKYNAEKEMWKLSEKARKWYYGTDMKVFKVYQGDDIMFMLEGGDRLYTFEDLEEAFEEWQDEADIVEVRYDGGESCEIAGKAVDYMMADIDGIELYAEAEPGESETDSYEELKAEILKQAKENNVSADRLKFWYD